MPLVLERTAFRHMQFDGTDTNKHSNAKIS
jgi:hypothetical protein